MVMLLGSDVYNGDFLVSARCSVYWCDGELYPLKLASLFRQWIGLPSSDREKTEVGVSCSTMDRTSLQTERRRDNTALVVNMYSSV
jgi:hypothetical protein